MKINREIEQAMRSLSLLARQNEQVTAREMADQLIIPFEKLSKILQKLNRHGIIQAERGRSGGYILIRPLEELTMADLYHALEKEEALVPCQSGRSCHSETVCSIKDGLSGFQRQWTALLQQTRLSDLVQEGGQ